MTLAELTALLDRLETLEKEATPGDWISREYGMGVDRDITITTAWGGKLFRSTSYGKMDEDADLIIGQKSAIPILISTLRRAMEVILEKDEALSAALHRIENGSFHMMDTSGVREALALKLFEEEK